MQPFILFRHGVKLCVVFYIIGGVLGLVWGLAQDAGVVCFDALILSEIEMFVIIGGGPG